MRPALVALAFALPSLAIVATLRPLYVALFLFASATLEHLFPPYPGDLAVALGAAATLARHDSVAVMFAAATAGSALGAVITFGAGRWLRTRGERSRSARVAKLRAALTDPLEWLGRRGVAALVLGRFVPVGRALVVVAAGYAGMPASRALPAAIAGGALWNVVLFAVGGTLGLEHAHIERWLAQYSRVAGALAAVLVIAWLARRWWTKRRAVTPRP